jgi:hypothetical protein
MHLWQRSRACGGFSHLILNFAEHVAIIRRTVEYGLGPAQRGSRIER